MSPGSSRDHFIVERNAPFFVRRFAGMRWTILTPACVAPTGTASGLTIGPGAAKARCAGQDDAEELWRTYYAQHLQSGAAEGEGDAGRDAEEILAEPAGGLAHSELIAGADEAAQEMIARMPTSPAPHHAKRAGQALAEARTGRAEPTAPRPRSIAELREAAQGLPALPAVARRDADRVRRRARKTRSVVFVGEQPGDQEDIAGKPFVGPAGKVFDAVLDEAGRRPRESLRHQRGQALQVRAARQAPHPLQAERRRGAGLPLVARQRTAS